MKFIGDIALPKGDSIDYHLPFFFNDSIIIANLEEALVNKPEKLRDSKIIYDLSNFNKISRDKYNKWFKKNRYHIKIITIYKVNDSQFITMCKDVFNRFRTLSINIFSFFNRSI